MEGLHHLDSIGGHLFIDSNDSLKNLGGLDQLKYIKNYVWILSNKHMTSLTGLDSLNYVGGNLSVFQSPVLTSLTGLQNVRYVGSYLTISSNPKLTSIQGLNGLQQVNGYLDFFELEMLSTLDGLENLTSINGYITIWRNPLLTSIQGLKNIDPAGISASSPSDYDIKIYENHQLSDCAIQSICGAFEMSGTTSNIYDNAPFCNTETEVKAQCQTISVDDLNALKKTILYPNPAVEEITLQTPVETQLIVANQIGQIVLLMNLVAGENTLNVRSWLPGIYFLKTGRGEVIRLSKI